MATDQRFEYKYEQDMDGKVGCDSKYYPNTRIIRDKKTGVQYLIYQSSVTVLVDKDGKPLLT
ncbi:hypothetical protein R84B8_03121 [Treponema sp. R8-4-B8]